jgi:hypothetical protein
MITPDFFGGWLEPRPRQSAIPIGLAVERRAPRSADGSSGAVQEVQAYSEFRSQKC